MSVPARELPVSRTPDPSSSKPVGSPAARPASSTPPQRRTRRGSSHRRQTAFWVFAAVLMTGLIMVVVSLNALVVNATYRLQSIQQEQRTLADDGAVLRIDVARLSSPSRISRWAEEEGMRMPASDEVIPLRVPGSGGGGV